jgi:hypothetical protein
MSRVWLWVINVAVGLMTVSLFADSIIFGRIFDAVWWRIGIGVIAVTSGLMLGLILSRLSILVFGLDGLSLSLFARLSVEACPPGVSKIVLLAPSESGMAHGLYSNPDAVNAVLASLRDDAPL